MRYWHDELYHIINVLQLSDAIRRRRSSSTLVQVMVCYHQATSYHVNHCWLKIIGIYPSAISWKCTRYVGKNYHLRLIFQYIYMLRLTHLTSVPCLAIMWCLEEKHRQLPNCSQLMDTASYSTPNRYHTVSNISTVCSSVSRVNSKENVRITRPLIGASTDYRRIPLTQGANNAERISMSS